MTDEERKEVERLAYVCATDGHTHGLNPIVFQSYRAGYLAACEAKRAELDHVTRSTRLVAKAVDMSTPELNAERARSAKLLEALDDIMRFNFNAGAETQAAAADAIAEYKQT